MYCRRDRYLGVFVRKERRKGKKGGDVPARRRRRQGREKDFQVCQVRLRRDMAMVVVVVGGGGGCRELMSMPRNRDSRLQIHELRF